MILGIESSCDETSVAVVHGGRLLSNVVASQIALHSEYGGVVPELATREHLRNLIPVARSAMAAAGIGTADLVAIGATQGPGLPAALHAGYTTAQTMAFVLGRPLYGINHHEAHLYSPWISGDPPRADFDSFQPNVSLIVSGGHTLLVHVRSELDHSVLGGTLDDAAGECFDKISKMLGLPYPGGPLMDRLAMEGDPNAYNFPRPRLNDWDDSFSFSGLKTSVRYFLDKNPGISEDPVQLRSLCASVQAAIVEVLSVKLVRAAVRLQVRCVTASGGVICNSGLRRELERRCQKHHLRLQIASRQLSTDNAAMVAVLAERKWFHGIAPTSLDTEARPGWALAETSGFSSGM